MKKVIPFSKDIAFKTNLSEITSISLEHTLQQTEQNKISGEFLITGEYKMVESSVNVEPFSFNVPFEIELDEKYILDNVVVDIDDFYYEIVNNETLSVNIEVLIDKLEEKALIETKNIVIEEEKENVTHNITINSFDELKGEEKMKEEIQKKLDESIEALREENESVRSLFDDFDISRETYTTYKIYIIKEGDTIESIIEKYSVNKEEIEKYNDLKEIKIGTKLIIPALLNAKI